MDATAVSGSCDDATPPQRVELLEHRIKVERRHLEFLLTGDIKSKTLVLASLSFFPFLGLQGVLLIYFFTVPLFVLFVLLVRTLFSVYIYPRWKWCSLYFVCLLVQLKADKFVDTSGRHVFEQISARHGILSIGTDPNFKLGARSKKGMRLCFSSFAPHEPYEPMI